MEASIGPKLSPALVTTALNSEISYELEILKRRISQQKVLELPQVWNVKATFIITDSDAATCHAVKTAKKHNDLNLNHFRTIDTGFL